MAGDRMAVHVRDARSAHEQVAVGLLVLDQPLDAAADGVLVAALLGVDVTGTQQGKEGQPGRRGVRVDRPVGGQPLAWHWSWKFSDQEPSAR